MFCFETDVLKGLEILLTGSDMAGGQAMEENWEPKESPTQDHPRTRGPSLTSLLGCSTEKQVIGL